MKEQFHKQHGLQQDSVKVTFISLFFFPIAATTLTIITQLICAGYTKYGKLIVIDVYELQSTSFSASSHITISISVEGNVLWQCMDNAQILYATEMTCLVDEQHSCPQTTKCFQISHQYL
jgi:hypothetical protein